MDIPKECLSNQSPLDNPRTDAEYQTTEQQFQFQCDTQISRNLRIQLLQWHT